MTAIGGFFEMERGHGNGGPWHAHALPLTSGRACLRAILDVMRPKRVLVPAFICDAALAPMRVLNIPFEFYRLSPALEPHADAWPDDAAVIVVNYFDLKGRGADAMVAALGERAIVDSTQAFFRRGSSRSYSFNSARKFFGVPDGAYVYGPDIAGIQTAGRNDAAPTGHLSARLAGDLETAYRQYLAAEAQVSCEMLSPSLCAQELLGGIAYDVAREARRRNFMQLHERLGAANTLAIDLSLDDDAAPFCYPLLPRGPSRHEALWRREIFVPRLWPEVALRSDPSFAWERDLATRLLPLPIDHRYGSRDMLRIGDAVCEVAA
jgi:hypothetical protein